MAHVIPSTKPQDPKGYNVDQAVGPNAPNASGDVKLVQYMLRHYYGQPAAHLKIDGYIGPITIGWIRQFQEDSKKAGVNVLVDSRIDRAFGQVSSISKTVYTILVLNNALLGRNPAAYTALPTQVPLNAAPKSNPYNPAKPRKIQSVWVFGQTPPHDVFVFYEDGGEERWKVAGSVQFPPGTTVIYSPRPYYG